jgi:2-polyprenyl-3-methyl-5-hydroxy-6-metoxy-1,4-benzoquinol methylase
VGCGEGILARELSELILQVTAIDLDEPSIALAQRQDAGAGIEYIHGNFLDYGFEPESFDFIASVAALHHMDANAGLDRMRQLLRPGGTLAVVGCARSSSAADLPFEIAGILANRVLRAVRTSWEHSAPIVWPPPETYASMRQIGRRNLPGARYRRHLLWRYSLIWTKPGVHV